MISVTAKVLLFRYVYVMRHRWPLTIAYMLFPLVLCLLPVLLNVFVKLEKYGVHVVEHDERALLRLPEAENCTSGERNVCQLKIVVCPDGPTERLLMDRVEGILRLSDNTSAMDITYVDHPDHMERILVSSNSNSSRGLIFHRITETKLDYTIRPFAEFIPSTLYDWGYYATNEKFPSPMYRGPRLTDPYFNVEDELGPGGATITLAGLLPLMVAVDKAYIETFFPNVSKDWILTSFPHPPYFEVPEQFRGILTYRFFLLFIQYLLIVGMSFMSMVCASYIIYEKESGIRECLHLYGAPRWMVNLSWLVSFCFEATLLAILELSILKIPTQNGQTLKYMSSSVLCLVLVVYNFTTLCWVYLSATIQNNAYVCILTIAAYWAFTPFLQWIPPDHFAMQGALATLPNAGLVLIFMSFQEFDGAETVLGMNRLGWKPIHYLPVNILLLIMLASSLLLILLSMYLDLVKPGKYGRAKPWYLFNRKEAAKGRDGNETLQRNDGRYFEPISSKDPIALECVNVSKFFGKRRTVDNINMKILKNQITVLLGNNGAGKTTFLRMLCGMYSSTKGHFYTENYDVFHGDNIKKFKKVMGYCPQYDWLMGELTVKQHFIIFALLKGLPQIEAQGSCTTWALRFDMVNSLNTKASKLSAVTRRKLCLAIAMIGDPLYLLLDDPLSSLDAESTRKFWNILLQGKGKCTVIMTAHDMNEADVLGDRIALMVKGQLKGYGTSSFLKKQLKAEYKLHCVVNKKSTRDVIRVVRNLVRSAAIIYQTHYAVTFALSIGKPEDMTILMANLESELGDDVSISLSYMSMDDVLIKVQPDIASPGTSLAGSQNVSADYSELLRIPDWTLDDSLPWSCGQVKEIFVKKLKWTCNRKTSLISILVTPILGVLLMMYLISEAIGLTSSHERLGSVGLTLDIYSGKRAFLFRRKNAIAKTLRLALKDSGIRYNEVFEDMVDYLNERAKKNRFSYRSQMVFAFDSGAENSNSPRAFYSRNAYHSAPIAYSALINAIIPGNASITTHNHPVAGDKKSPSCYSLNPRFITLLFNIIMGPTLLIVSSYFIAFPYIERQTLFKHLQLMTGLLPLTYWIANLMFDFLIFTITSLLMISTLAIVDVGLFQNPPVITVLIIVLLLYGISIILFAYTCSFCRCAVSTIVIVFITIHPLLLIGYLVLRATLEISFGFVLSDKGLYFLPWMILIDSLQKIITWAVERIACLHCRNAESCEFILKHSLIPSLKNEFFTFVIVALVYFAFIVAMDHGFGRKLQPMVERMFYGEIKDDQDAIDPDFAREKKTVEDLEMEEEEYRSELICDGLGKKYTSKATAVRDVTFAADRGEMFGILGTDGAGKSTTFGMLSGLISPTKGLATVRGKWELGDCEYKYIRNFGYCPQFYGYLPGFTGINTLRLFGHLRGFEPPLLDSQVALWLRVMDMESIAHQPCEFYSEGNKRKLSFAIAMIGSPPVLLLDEPTTSIDPVIRRRIWDILLPSLRKLNQTIILNSHIMSECEPLCDRLMLMVKGELKTLGSVSTLKNKYGSSCSLLVKLKRDTNRKQMYAIRSKILVESRFSRFAQLREERPTLLNINVNTRMFKTYNVFADMVVIKEQISKIEDFRLIETPLEEAFRTFAEENKSKEVKTSQTKERGFPREKESK